MCRHANGEPERTSRRLDRVAKGPKVTKAGKWQPPQFVHDRGFA
jgi:hypothetical protein